MLLDSILKWVGVILPLLLGGGLLAWFKYFKENRQEYRDYAASELLKVTQELTILRTSFKELQAVLIPTIVPEWRKNFEREYEYVNQNYEFVVLLPIGLTKEDLLGKTDEQVFKKYPEFLELMNELDREARKAKNRFIIKHGVYFPENSTHTAMVVKEIVQNISGKIYYVGRAYMED